MTYLNVPLGSLQEGDSSRRFLVCDGCVSSQGELLALTELHGIKVLIRHGRVGYKNGMDFYVRRQKALVVLLCVVVE